MKAFAKTPARCLLSLLCSGMCLNGAESGTATANAEQSKPVLTLEAQCAAPFADKAVFDHTQSGLMLARKDGYEPPVPTPDAPIPWLSVQAKNGTWHWAEVVIEGSDLLVSSKEVAEPVAVRYTYTQNPAGFNLYNKDGLPASPFSTCGY